MNLALTIFSFVYVGLFLSFVVLLRLFGTNVQGMLSLVSLIAVVKMGDTGAYTVGRLFGRHKMTPRLSPGKTWEGAAGAMLFVVIGSWAVFDLLGPRLSNRSTELLEPWRWIVYGLVVGVAGMIGDLAESLLKRDAGQKDSSTWMPGFGGRTRFARFDPICRSRGLLLLGNRDGAITSLTPSRKNPRYVSSCHCDCYVTIRAIATHTSQLSGIVLVSGAFF